MNAVSVSIPKDWWPICRKCGRVVDAVVSLPGTGDMRKDAVRDFEVYCHGEKEKHFVGIWATHEIVVNRKRLPDVFTDSCSTDIPVA
jgi:hypothetical protein